jgi:hypothetical protein
MPSGQLLRPADRIDPGADQIGSLRANRETTGEPSHRKLS